MNIHPRTLLRVTVVVAAGATLYASAAAAVTTSSFTLGGDVLNPGVYDLARLQGFPAQTRAVGSDTYVGASLWGVIQDAAPRIDPAVHNDILSKIVIATGSDGYKATLSLGEINPSFGGAGEPHLVAYDRNGAGLGEDGFARIVSPDDFRHGRFVSNLASLEVVDAAPGAATLPGGPSKSFTVSGAVADPGRIRPADLAALTPVTQEVTYLSGSGENTRTFTGVGLWDFLDSRGVLTDDDVKNDILRKALVVTATDGYQVAFSLGELSPTFGDPLSRAMIATFDEFGALEEDGFARLVLAGDVRGGRFLSNIADMRVIDITAGEIAPIPVPAGLALALTGLGALLGVGGLRRRRAGA